MAQVYDDPVNQSEGHPPASSGKYLALLALTAMGVVYGDIGTSPLYSFRESFGPHYGLPPTPTNVLGILSLIFWALILIISVKYVIFVMRADNQGEGGMMALTALISPMRIERRTGRWGLILLGLFGTALLYGDGMITPAISVLSAVEGLEVATPLFQPFVIPITVGILIFLFLFQRMGTARVGRIFGPLMLLWFLTIALLGVRWILVHPSVFAAMNPLHAARFFAVNGSKGYFVLGSVFLAVTGGEALYADLGHFGRRPIRAAWFVVVLPTLLLNYFGQGALLLEKPEAIGNPFFNMVPSWALYPVVILATIATVIASQALITGAFSLTMQAVRLGYLPRMEIIHTSSIEKGQIYIPAINMILMVACIALVLAFRTSSNLAAAYGVGVTTDMVLTTILLAVVIRERWQWPLARTAVLIGLMLVVDVAFWGANLVKIPDGGWFPLVIGVIGFVLMTTWKRGRTILRARIDEQTMPFEAFLKKIEEQAPLRVPGTAVFMYSNPRSTPPALLQNLAHNKVLHEEVVFLSVVTHDVPRVPEEERLEVRKLAEGIYQVVIHYGFMAEADVPAALALLAERYDGRFDPAKVSYFLGREQVLPSDRPGMPRWREHLFAMMSRNARNATDFFSLPPERVVELGSQVEI